MNKIDNNKFAVISKEELEIIFGGDGEVVEEITSIVIIEDISDV